MSFKHYFHIRKDFECDDCGEAGPQLLVIQNELWDRLCQPPCPGILCPACMRVRWGKDFLFEDLIPVPGNLRYVLDHWPERAFEFTDLIEVRLLHLLKGQMYSLRSFVSSETFPSEV